MPFQRAAFLFALGALLCPLPSHAVDLQGLEFTGSGFMTLAAGRVFGGTRDAAVDQGFHCPCFISDYAQRGVYEAGHWQAGPDSKLGLQGSVSAADGRFSLTGQAVSRGAANGAANLEWLYATVELSGNLTVQLGRKRLPLFSYSEAQDVGYALPWIHLPPQLYGWEVVNYDGGSLVWRDQWAQWNGTVQVFGGSETRKDSGFWRIYNGRNSRTDVRWSDILGTELSVSREWFSARVVRIQSHTQNKLVSLGETSFSERKRQVIHGLSLGAEVDNWFARGEFLYIDRRDDYGKDYANLLAIGYRHGPWQPLLSRAIYRQRLNNDSVPERHGTWSAVLRYDLTDDSAIKAQLDLWKDRTAPGYGSMHGDARQFTVSYDRVF